MTTWEVTEGRSGKASPHGGGGLLGCLGRRASECGRLCRDAGAPGRGDRGRRAVHVGFARLPGMSSKTCSTNSRSLCLAPLKKSEEKREDWRTDESGGAAAHGSVRYGWRQRAP